MLSPIGVTEGKLQVSIVPLDKNGNEGPWDDDDELKGKKSNSQLRSTK